jgi:RNA methyltransferase, TrmH family
MPTWQTITSSENPQLKAIRQLQTQARQRHQQQLVVLEGIHLCQAAALAKLSVRSTLVAESAQLLPPVLELVDRLDRVLLVPDKLFRQNSQLEQGASVIQVVALPSPSWPNQWQGDGIFLDGIQDPGNLGTLLRTCAAAGVAQVYLSHDCVDPWSPKVLRAGMGGHFGLHLFSDCTIEKVLALRPAQVIATTLSAKATLFGSDLRAPALWCFGNEGAGLRAATLTAIADWSVQTPALGGYLQLTIEQASQVESLNVAAAAAVCLFEQRRQRSLPVD